MAELVGRRLEVAYAQARVSPPSPTWPFTEDALGELEGLWPRQILMRCEGHRQRYLSEDAVSTFGRFDGVGGGTQTVPYLAGAFARHRAEAKLGSLDISLDDGEALGRCLRAAMEMYLRQLTLPKDVDAAVAAPAGDPRPSLHARLAFTFRNRGDLEKHFCFRVIAHSSARAVQPRLRAAMTDSGIDRRLPFRHLFIIRGTPLPGGKVTVELLERLKADGGTIVRLEEEDLRTIVALLDMAEAKVEGLDAWLKERKPLCETAFFRAVGLCPPPEAPSEAPPRREDAETLTPMTQGAGRPIPAGPSPSPKANAGATATPRQAEPKAATIPLGRRVEGGGLGASLDLPASLLTRHTAIFAGSGSGKTVLLRRLVEEAALLGCPAIVIDTNNDLARLGQPWPSRPAGFDDADVAKAARYASDVEVVVWTPGVAAGRPLVLSVLPDFAAVSDDEEREQAASMAWSTLSPLVGGTGPSKVLKDGVLREALAAFAAERRSGIDRFVDYLSDLPAEVSKLRKAQDHAAAMADQLRAKIALNPLLAGRGQPLDPAVLFTADRRGATRVSVINFAGLESDASRQDFVNQLQMALFTFIRRQPSETPRLYICDEAQNFAPSQGVTASKASAIALARQGRKFGLGMVFATQAPKGIDTNIVSNCVTHFYGRISSPAHLDAAVAMMEAKGRGARDLGGLLAGTFYASTEGLVSRGNQGETSRQSG